MSLKLVMILAAAVLALAQGAPLLEGPTSQMLFQSCNPHLRLPNGSRMEVDLVTYYSEVDPKCLGGLVMATFNFQKRFGGLVMATFNFQKRFKLFETKEDTAICHGFIELLSLIDAYNWTQEMCAKKAIADERGSFCKTYNTRLKDIELLTLKYNTTGYNHLTVVGLLLSRMGEENCLGVCGGMMNSTLCNSFVDASRFFLTKFESDPPQEKLIIPEENKKNVSPGQPPNVDTATKETAIAATPTREAINTTASVTPESETTAPTPSESSTTEDTAPPSKEPTVLEITAGPPSSSINELTEQKDETLPLEPQQPPDDTSISDDLADVLDQFDMTKEDLLRVLGPNFHEDLNRMDYMYEDIIDVLDEAAEFEEGDVDITNEVDGILEPLATAESDIPEVKPQDMDEMAKQGMTKVDDLEKDFEEEVKRMRRSYGSWHFFTIILILAAFVIGGYLCVHNWTKDVMGKDQRETMTKVKTFGYY